jgi:hypothetical protein
MVGKVLVLLAGFATACPAQGLFLSDGQSGPWINGALGREQGSAALGASVGYCFAGVFDAGLSMTRTLPTPSVRGGTCARPASTGTAVVAPAELPEKGSAITLEPSVAMHLFTGDSRIPFSFALSASYRQHYYLDEDDLTGRAYTTGASIYRAFDSLPGLTLIPEIAVRFTSLRLLKDSWSGTRSSSYWNLMPMAALHASFDLSPSGSVFHIDGTFGYTRLKGDETVRTRRVRSLGCGVTMPGIL